MMKYGTAKECREERGSLVKQMQDMAIRAKTENRTLSAEERESFDRLDKEQERLKSDAESFERIERIEGLSLEESRSQLRKEVASVSPVFDRRDHDKALRGWLSVGTDADSEEGRKWASRFGYSPTSSTLKLKLRSDAPRSIQELRAQSTTNSAGGYTVPNDNSLINQVETALLAYGGMREAARVIRTDSGANLPIPLNNDTSNKGAIVAENGTLTGTDLVFSQVVMGAYKYNTGSPVAASVEILQDSAIDIGVFIGEALGVRLGRILNDHFTTGTGSGQPQGVVTGATSAGNSTAANLAAGPAYGDLTKLYHSVDPEYRKSPSCRWMFSDAVLQKLKEIVDGDSRPLWQPGLAGFAAGQQDTILGKPYTINQSMAGWTASAKYILFGDFSKYLIRDVSDLMIRRLDERYAELGQVAWIGFSRHDGVLLDAGTRPVKYLVAPGS